MNRCIRPNYEQQWLFPPALEDLIPQDHPARFIRAFVGEQNLRTLGIRLPSAGPGQPPWDPAVLLAVWLLGFYSRVRSTRKLEAACREQFGFAWLTGLRAPDHSVLWAFFTANRTAIRQLFQQTVRVAVTCGEIGLALHAVDGTRLEGAGSRHTAWHRAQLEKQLAQAAATAAQAIEAEILAAQAGETPLGRLTGALADATQRVDAIQAALAALDAADTDHRSSTDPDARMQHLADGPNRLGYNAEAVVECRHGLIVAAEVVPDGSDAHQLVPMLDQVQETLGTVAEETAADGGFFSGEQLAQAEAAEYPVLVHLPAEPETAANPYHKSRFCYDADRDAYQCPRGEWLSYVRDKAHKERGYTMRVYSCSCRTCPVKTLCTKEQRRQILRTPFEDAVARQQAKQAVPENRLLLGYRKALVERVFGQIKQHDGFRRFTVWGLEAVRAQWALVCSAVNLRVLYRLWRSGVPVLSTATRQAA